MKSWLNGKKSYIVAIMSLLALIVAWTDGKVGNYQFIQDVIGLILAMTIRHGISTSLSQAIGQVSQDAGDVTGDVVDSPTSGGDTGK